MFADCQELTSILKGGRIWNELTNKIVQWESREKEIKRDKTVFVTKEKILEAILEGDKYVEEVLDYLKEDKDPEPSLGTIEKKVMTDKRYGDASQTGTERPTYDTVIRRLVSRLSRLPDFTLAEPAQQRYSKLKRGKRFDNGSDPDWWTLRFEELIAGTTDRCQFVFLIDALDECSEIATEEQHPAAVKFLKFMRKVMSMVPNISLLCSSHQHVPMFDYFGPDDQSHGKDMLQLIEVTPTTTLEQMKNFVTVELERRMEQEKEKVEYKQSVFCKYHSICRSANRWYQG